MKQILILVAILAMFMSMYAQMVELSGSGASFPYPLYSHMFSEYSKTHARINYNPNGSGAGINQLIERLTDFGGTDALLTPEQIQRAGGTILHIPTCLGAVVITYNLPTLRDTKLKLTAEVIAEIFMGKITRWNDRKIAALNPGIRLPNLAIGVVYRAESSGTSFIFTEYLTKTHPEWASTHGTTTTLNLRHGIGAQRSAGVAATIGQIPGSIGYMELVYALENNMPFAEIRNKHGRFITPTMETVSESANVTIPADGRVSLTDTDAENGYPISSFTWIIIYQDQSYKTAEKARATVDLVSWMITDGQKFAAPLRYAPLPEAAVKVGLDMLGTVKF
jgi:phosphate transport system substrate-binding protein